MSERTEERLTDLDDALERVIAAARTHLAAVKAADGAVDDEAVWDSYVALNNASYEYDQLLLDTYGEVTPWETEPIGRGRVVEEEAEAAPGGVAPATDPYPAVVSVRQRRDFRVPSVSALLAEAGQAARRLDEEVPAPQSVGEAVLGLVQAGDGGLGSLDVPVLEPLQGVVTVVEVAAPLDLDAAGDGDTEALFRSGPDDRLVARLDEYRTLDLDREPSPEPPRD
ncbi:MAG: hypothetical protein FWJ70_15410 [Micromonosporaceae bacterium]|jgi:hypothetical protein